LRLVEGVEVEDPESAKHESGELRLVEGVEVEDPESAKHESGRLIVLRKLRGLKKSRKGIHPF
jgi:hypothetical protein